MPEFGAKTRAKAAACKSKETQTRAKPTKKE